MVDGAKERANATTSLAREDGARERERAKERAKEKEKEKETRWKVFEMFEDQRRC